MQDMIISVVEPFTEPVTQSNFVVFKNTTGVVPTSEGAGYFRRCKRYARQYNTYVVTSLMNIADYLCLCMFSPDGRIAGAQRALYLSRENRTTYQKCSNLAVFTTPFGKVYLCVDADIYSPEAARYARRCGCEIVVSSQWFSKYDDNLLVTGGWGSAQTNNFLVISANNHTAAISVPFLASTDNSGYMVPPSPTASTAFNLNRLSETPSAYLNSHFNQPFFSTHSSLL